MSDTARVLLTAGVLSTTAFAMFVWKLTRLDAAGPDRLVAQLRLAQWAALVLASIAGVSLGLTIAHDEGPFGSVEVALAVAFLIVAAIATLREPRSALHALAIGFVLHALFDIAHRPGGLPNVAPQWYAVGCSIYDVCLGGLCYWAARR